MSTYTAYVEALKRIGVAYVHAIQGTTFVSRINSHAVDYQQLRVHFGGTFIANNTFGASDGEAEIAAGRADLISYGRAFIANPDLVARFKQGGPVADAPKQYWYGGGNLGYTDWPTMRDASSCNP
jgi:N-ethylmaleimide reductase